jgi:hypothetical protein
MASEKKGDEKVCARMAKALALDCVRNTYLEELHAGIFPRSATGDYSDVKVVGPYGEIPWTRLSRISDQEMKRFMNEVVNSLYTVLMFDGEIPLRDAPSTWDKPQLVDAFVMRLRDKQTQGRSEEPL